MVAPQSDFQVAVSVLMPVYNCEPYLRESLESLEKQSFHDFEVILVNDGSTDQSELIAREFAERDHRFRIHSQANQGIVAALNNGLAVARGKFLARLDGDDLAHPDRLALQVQHLETHPECVCVGSLYRAIDEVGNVTWTQKMFSKLRQTDLSVFPPHVTTLPHPSIMLRTQQLKSLSGYRHQFPHAEDYDLFLRLSQLGRLDIVPAYLLNYRFHSSSLSSKNLETQVDSAVLAVWSALARHQGDIDPAENATHFSLSSALERAPAPSDKALFSLYRHLRVVGAWMNRGNLVMAKVQVNALFMALLRNAFLLKANPRFWTLAAATMKLRLKIALGRI